MRAVVAVIRRRLLATAPTPLRSRARRRRLRLRLADESAGGLTPRLGGRSHRAVAAFAGRRAGGGGQHGRRHGEIMREADPACRSTVRATRQISARRAGVAIVRGPVKHAGTFPALEGEMCDLWTGSIGPLAGPARPLVWAVTALYHVQSSFGNMLRPPRQEASQIAPRSPSSGSFAGRRVAYGAPRAARSRLHRNVSTS